MEGDTHNSYCNYPDFSYVVTISSPVNEQAPESKGSFPVKETKGYKTKCLSNPLGTQPLISFTTPTESTKCLSSVYRILVVSDNFCNVNFYNDDTLTLSGSNSENRITDIKNENVENVPHEDIQVFSLSSSDTNLNNPSKHSNNQPCIRCNETRVTSAGDYKTDGFCNTNSKTYCDSWNIYSNLQSFSHKEGRHVADCKWCHLVSLKNTIYLTCHMDAVLLSCIVTDILHSETFRRNVMAYVLWNFGFKGKPLSNYIPVVNIVLQWPQRCHLGLSWSKRMQHLLVERQALEESAAWLSTLGGGYSALGDYFEKHAETAGKVSLHQLKLAMRLGDYTLAAKCRLYFAQSIMQRGLLRQAKHIIKNEYKSAVTSKVRDEKLNLICQAMWSRLKYFYSQKHHKRNNFKKNGMHN